MPLLRVGCPACGAEPGQLCVSAPPSAQGEPVTSWGVHQRRVMAQFSEPGKADRVAVALERIATALERIAQESDSLRRVVKE